MTRHTTLFGFRNMLGFVRDPLGWLRRVADAHGDFVEMPVFGKRWVVLSHPDDIEAVMIRHAKSVTRDDYMVILQRPLGMGLLTSDGELWKRQRKVMAQAFTPKRIRGYADAMARVTDASLSRWRSGETVNLHEEMSRVTMEVVADVLFGTGVSAEDVLVVRDSLEHINAFLRNSPEAILKLPGWVPTPLNRRTNEAIAAIDRIVYRIIEERRRAGDAAPKDDLLGVLLGARDDDGAGMSDRQLRDECVTLFLAGHETTALALAATIYLLSTTPHVEERLVAELERVLGGRLPSADDVRALAYTDQVIKEAMRLYPPAWTTGREVAEPFAVRGHHLAKGTQILMSQWVVHRDPRFFPDPEAFDPDRWEPARASALPRYAYFPFGGGPRVCIGNHFAMMEASLILATVMSRFHVELLPGERLELDPSVTLRQKGAGLRVRLHAREVTRVELADATALPAE